MSYGNSNYGQGGDQYSQGGKQGGDGQGQPDYGQPGYGQGGQPNYGQGGQQGGYGQPAQSQTSAQDPYTQSSAQDPYTQSSAPDPYGQQGNYAQPGYDQGYAQPGYDQGYGQPGYDQVYGQQGYGGVQPYAGGYGGGYDAAHPPRPPVGPVAAIKQFFLNYANFYGRANRGEYWWYALASVLVSMIISIPGNLLGTVDTSSGILVTQMHPAFAALSALVGLATLIPSISVGVRRLHDTGRSGYWLLLGLGWWLIVPAIILIVFLAGPSKPEGVRFDNPDGSQPKIAA